MFKLLLCALTLQCLPMAAAVAQADGGSTDKNICSGLTTVAQCLTIHHISLSAEDLIVALHSEDPVVWNLAASQLAHDGEKDAIPDLLILLSSKSAANERIAVAVALAELGEDKGIKALLNYCAADDAPLSDRLYAADRLLKYEPASCPNTLIDGLRDDSVLVQALSLIPDFKEVSPTDAVIIRDLLFRALSNLNVEVRVQAAQTMRTVGDGSAIPALESALLREKNPMVRGQITDTLRALKGEERVSVIDETKPQL